MLLLHPKQINVPYNASDKQCAASICSLNLHNTELCTVIDNAPHVQHTQGTTLLHNSHLSATCTTPNYGVYLVATHFIT